MSPDCPTQSIRRKEKNLRWSSSEPRGSRLLLPSCCPENWLATRDCQSFQLQKDCCRSRFSKVEKKKGGGFSHSRMAVTWKEENNRKCWQGCGDIGTPVPCRWECKMVQLLWEALWQFFSKIIIELHDQAILHLGIKRTENSVQTKTCTWMFTAELFTIAKRWKIPKCPLTDEQINWMDNVVYPYNGAFISHKNEWSPDTSSNMGDTWKHDTKWQKSDTKGHILYHSVNVK